MVVVASLKRNELEGSRWTDLGYRQGSMKRSLPRSFEPCSNILIAPCGQTGKNEGYWPSPFRSPHESANTSAKLMMRSCAHSE